MASLSTQIPSHTISQCGFKRYRSVEPHFRAWLKRARVDDVEFKRATLLDDQQRPRAVAYPDVLDASGEPRHADVLHPFYEWYANVPNVQGDPIKWAISYFKTSCEIERGARAMPMLPSGYLSAHMSTRVIRKTIARKQGNARIASCFDVRKRVDNSLLTHAERERMLRAAVDADARVSCSPLAVLQTGAQVCIALATGVRGQKLRTATFEHMWVRRYAEMPHVPSVVLYNTRKGKTNEPGEATHAAWFPARNPLFSPSFFVGLGLLYRFGFLAEAFPSVRAHVDGAHVGYAYKWLPLFVSDKGAHALDVERALLSARGVSDKTQNACWNKLMAVAGVLMCAGDAVTHAGRYACQQEFVDAGGAASVVEDALGYTHSVSHDSYKPNIPPVFLFQRAGFGLLAPNEYRHARSPQTIVARERADDVAFLVDGCVPGLRREEETVASIATGVAEAAEPVDATGPTETGTRRRRLDVASVRAQKRINRNTRVREHGRFLECVRALMGEAIVCAACRPRTEDGSIDVDELPLWRRHEHSSPILRSIVFSSGRDDGWSGRCAFDHPRFAAVCAAVRAAEEAEVCQGIVRPEQVRLVEATVEALERRLGPSLRQLERLRHLDALAHLDALLSVRDGFATIERVAATLEWLDEGTRAARATMRARDDAEVAALKRATIEPSAVREELRERALDELTRNLASLRDWSAEAVAERQRAAGGAANQANVVAEEHTVPRRLRTECVELRHAKLGNRDVASVWCEYVERLSELEERTNGAWRDDPKNRDLWYEKLYIYREIARVVHEDGTSVEEAVRRTQIRVNGFKKGHSAGWAIIKQALKPEQRERKEELNARLRDLIASLRRSPPTTTFPPSSSSAATT